MSIRRRLARLMGGEFTVHSEVAKGSVFALWLPVVTMDDVAAARAGILRLTPA
jgi:signal transduction histidine kinase